jgi:hypothetical protein
MLTHIYNLVLASLMALLAIFGIVAEGVFSWESVVFVAVAPVLAGWGYRAVRSQEVRLGGEPAWGRDNAR